MQPLLIALADELGISRDALADRGLPACEEAACLEVAEVGRDGREHLLVEPAATAWRALKAAALDDGISLFIVSAFRSIERQAEIVRRKLAEGRCIDDILAVCAPPGFSEHHSGRAVDVSTPGVPSLEIEFEQTPAFAWLDGRAHEFAFYLSYPRGNALGYQYEPWHWCYHDAQPVALREPDAFG
jgi:D-alanyl-D-alanine carboxypeptidase